VSQLLQAWNDGDETALEKLMPLVYKEEEPCDSQVPEMSRSMAPPILQSPANLGAEPGNYALPLLWQP
jgi:hypothetical protein